MTAFLLFEELETAINKSQPQKARQLRRELAELGWTVSYTKPKPKQKQTTNQSGLRATGQLAGRHPASLK
jgi:hypothetical protein